MHYIFTSDYYLWVGLSSILSPYETVWVFNARQTAINLDSIDDDDVCVFDSSNDTTFYLMYLKKTNTTSRFVFLTRGEDIPVRLFISNCVHKSLREPLSEIRCFILSEKNNPLLNGRFSYKLTSREICIIDMSVDGFRARKIAELLGIKIKTVYAHRINACRKLGVKRVSELLPYKNLLLFKTLEMKDAPRQEANPEA